MIKNLRPEEESIIKKTRNLFRLKEEPNKGRILRDMKNLFEHEKEEENYYKQVRVNNFCSDNYIEYESNSERNKTLSVE